MNSTRTSQSELAELADLLATLPECMGADMDSVVCAPSNQSELTCADVIDVAELIGIDFASVPFSAQDLHLGMIVELEHEHPKAPTDIIDDDLLEIGKAAVSHLHERPDYYVRLTQAHAPGDPRPPEYQYADVGTD